MVKRPWLAPSMLIILIGLAGLASSSMMISRVAAGLAVVGGLAFLVGGEIAARRRG